MIGVNIKVMKDIGKLESSRLTSTVHVKKNEDTHAYVYVCMQQLRKNYNFFLENYLLLKQI